MRWHINNRSVTLEIVERLDIGRLLVRSSLPSEGFFRSGVTMEDVSEDGKVPVERERLTILQMVSEIEEDMSLSRLVGIGSRSQ